MNSKKPNPSNDAPIALGAEKRSIGEHVLNIFKAFLSAAPFTGALASLLADYIPTQRQKRVEEFAEQIARDPNRLQSKVRAEYVLTDEFAYLFERCFRAVAENPQKDKIEAFRGILVNSVLMKSLPEDEKEYFLTLATNLSTLHLRILRFMATPEDYLKAVSIPAERVDGGFAEVFRVVFAGVQLEVARSVFADLHQYGLITTDKSIFGTTTAGRGIGLIKGRVSQLGNSFIGFCTIPV